MNQLKQVAEIKNIKGNEKLLLNFAGFENIYQAKKESPLKAPAIYEYIQNEYNDRARQINEYQRDAFRSQVREKTMKAIQEKLNREFERVNAEVKAKKELEKIKTEQQKQKIKLELKFKILKLKDTKKELRLKQSKNNFTTKSIKN